MSEKVTVKVERNILHLPAIALRGLVVFPNNLLHFEVGRDKSIAAVEWAVRNKSEVFLIAQKDMKAEDPKAEEMYQYGVVAEIKQVMRVSDDLVRILVEGKFRAKRTELDTDGSFLLASVRPAPVRPIKAEEETEAEALLRNVKTSFDAVLSMNPRISKDVVFAVTSNNDPAFLCEYIPANLLFRFEDKQAVMEESTLIGRLRLLVERLHRERRMLEIDKEIAQKVDEAMDKNQRDYYLHEQMHMISQELGEDDDTTAEAEEYRRRIQELHLDEEREKKLLKEVDRLAKMQSSNQEGTVIRTYLDTCLDLPWNSFTEDDLDIAKAQRILDRDHYGLEKVKERILEFIAVRRLNPDARGQIICLVGPPGVGKTSIALSIAKAMNRKVARLSLGGVRDEADIRGHRKTYIGAMPGRIIEAISRSGSMNPLLVLDEVDKLASDQRGDPASAHFFRITSSAPLPTVPHTTGEPLIIPAFSAAIFSSVSPRYPVWSSAMFVIAEITGAPITFVESSLPPIPHSRTTVSQPFLTKYSNAHAVMSSNSVARSSIESAAGRTASTTDASSLSEISCPSADILSLNFTRYGEVKSPARTPAAFRTE